MSIGRTVIFGDPHFGCLGQELGSSDRTSVAAIINYATQSAARLIVAGDMTDRALVKKPVAEAQKICRPVADALHQYCEDTLLKVHRVFGNHDSFENPINQWFPGVYFKHHHSFLTVEDANDPCVGLFVTHGHLLSGSTGTLMRQTMKDAGDKCSKIEIAYMMNDPTFIAAGLRSLSQTTLIRCMSLLHRVGAGGMAERMLFAYVKRRNAEEQSGHQEALSGEMGDSGHTVPSSLAGMVAECAGYFGRLGVYGHDHDPRIVERITSYGNRVTIANAGGWLPSDRGPRRFLEVRNGTIALHAVGASGNIEKGDPMQWAG